jgi:hypothetical protein
MGVNNEGTLKERECWDCGRLLPIKNFKLLKDGRREKRCYKCANMYARYGLTGKDFYVLLDQQDHKCAICGDEITDMTARIDHCHDSLLIRALLCHQCNVGIGMLRHNERIIEAAKQYINKYKV